MIIIIDTNVISIVFNVMSKKHDNFKPVYRCITDINCNGIMVYGGTKYIKELTSTLHQKYNRLFVQLRNIGRLQELDRDKVDRLEKGLKIIEPCKNFDDEHIIACIILSGCKLKVTDDKRADKYIKDEGNKFYTSPKMKPKIYRYRSIHEKMIEKCF